MFKLFGFLAVFTLIGLGGTFSEEGLRHEIGDDVVRAQVVAALSNIQGALCGDDEPCSPATAVELANPPLSLDEARAILVRGATSGAAEVCGLNWETESFLPMMKHWREAGKTDRQLALIAMLHGAIQQSAIRALRNDCTDSLRQKLKAVFEIPL